jgi:uncharacterized protein (TIGR04141 family)
LAQKSEIPQRDLTVYLLKTDVDQPAKALRKPSGLKHFPIASSAGIVVGDLYVKPPHAHPPKWASLFEGHVALNELGRVASTAAVLLVKSQTRLFAITFGQGRHLLVPDCWEERFGLRVVLNSIPADRLRSLDKRTFDALSTQSRTQSSREGSAPDFGLDVEQDLVRAVTGTPVGDALGKTLSGMDSLHSSVRVTLDTLKPLVRQYYLKGQEPTYKTTFPWVDHIADVADSNVIAMLDERLETVVNSTRDRCWLCVPEIIDWAATSGFRYRLGADSPTYADLHFEGFFESLTTVTMPDVAFLKSRRAHQVSNEGVVMAEWSVYKCTYCEIEHKGSTYILSGGRWYRVEASFVAGVNKFFAEFKHYAKALPPYNDASEGAYCKRVATASSDEYALMDQKTVAIDGAYGKVEFCDLFTSAKDLIHIKRYGASSVLSHLFSQGVVSGEAFRSEPTFRNGVLKLLPSSHHCFTTTDPISAGDYRIVFAVISDRDGALTLPFFSRVNLRHAWRRLNAIGYQTALAKITVAPEKSKLKKYQTK